MRPELRKDGDPFIEIRFGPKWLYVSSVRAFIQNFLQVTFESRSLADMIAMSVSELIENAVKYSDENDSLTRVEIKDDQCIVLVSNHATQEQVEILQEFFSELMAKDPMESYLALMQKSTEDGKQSHLGLARIRCEAKGDLALQIADGVVSVTATFNIEEDMPNG